MNTVASVFETMSYPAILQNQSIYSNWLKTVQNQHITFDLKDLQKARDVIRVAPWHTSTLRATLLFKLAKAVESQKELFASVESAATKKPLSQTKERDIPDLIRHLYSAAHAATFCPENWSPHGAVGVILGDSPSLCQSMPVGPALAAGNSVFLCGLEENYQSALLLVETASKIGFPPGVLNLVVDGLEDWIPEFDFIVESSSKPQKSLPYPRIWRLNTRPKAVITESADLASAAHGVIRLAAFNAPMSPHSGACVLVQECIFDSFWTELASAVQKLLPLPTVWSSSGDFYFHLDNQTQSEERSANIREAERQGVELVFPSSCNPHEGKHGPILIRGLGPAFPLVQRTQTSVDAQIIWVQSFRHAKEAVTLANSAPGAEYVSIWGEHTSALLEIAKDIHAPNIWINTQNIIDTAENMYTHLFLSKPDFSLNDASNTKKYEGKGNVLQKDLNSAVSSARAALKKWKDLGVDARSQFIFSLADHISGQQESLKKYSLSSGDLEALPRTTRYLYNFASQVAIAGLKSAQINASSSAKCWTWIMPHGVVGVLLPRISGVLCPLLTALAAAIAAGNTFIAILDNKLVADTVRKMVSDSAVPAGVVNILHTDGSSDNALLELLKADIDAAWILQNCYRDHDVDYETEVKRTFPVSYLNMTTYDWKKEMSQEALREWFQSQAVRIKKIWFQFDEL